MADAPENWRPNVAAIVMDSAGHVLLGSTPGRSPYWHFPQGGVRKKETFQEAVCREVQEEVGLPPSACQVIARYGGLRYHYRSKNSKSDIWTGQEQTYFLLLCHEEKPAVRCLSAEFATLEWVPWQRLSKDLFVPFKLPAIKPALKAFFPKGLVADPVAHAQAALSPQKYRVPSGQPEFVMNLSPDDRSLFGGGKDEMAGQLADFQRCFQEIQKTASPAVVVLLGLPGSGRTHILRQLARLMDPLHTRAVQPQLAPGSDSMEILRLSRPQSGEWMLLNRSPWDDCLQLLQEGNTLAADSLLQELHDYEQSLAASGIRLLKLYLQADSPTETTARFLSTAAPHPWYIIPAARRWYAVFAAASLAATLADQGLFV